MGTTAFALLAYVTLALVAPVFIVTVRTIYTLTGHRRANSFAPTGEDVSPLMARAARVHANIVENLPIFAAIALLALVTARTNATDVWAPVVVALRAGQMTAHLISTNVIFVLVRFTFFSAQLALLGWMALSMAIGP